MVEQATKRYQSITESTGFMLAVTTLGGFLNSYTYATRDGVFANMHTGNMTRLGISLADGAWAEAGTYLAAIVAAILGALFCEGMKRRTAGRGFGNWRRNLLAVQFVLLFAAGLIPSGWQNLLVTCAFSFLAESLLAMFGKWEGRSHSVTICTGNLRNFGQYLYPVIFERTPEALRTAGLYGLLVASFAFGAGVGIPICRALGTYAAWVGCAVLVVLFLAIRREDRAN